MAASSPFQPVSVAVSAGIGLYRSVSEAGIGPNKKKTELALWTPCWGESGAGAAALEPHPCFLAQNHTTTIGS